MLRADGASWGVLRPPCEQRKRLVELGPGDESAVPHYAIGTLHDCPIRRDVALGIVPFVGSWWQACWLTRRRLVQSPVGAPPHGGQRDGLASGQLILDHRLKAPLHVRDERPQLLREDGAQQLAKHVCEHRMEISCIHDRCALEVGAQIITSGRQWRGRIWRG